ncbi:MAG: DUF928 domain-containing protein [Acidobacteriia bacterium]|nr:DUF928 domain-containing protein [Terriglobia bacterium]
MKSLLTVFIAALIWLPLQQTTQSPASPPPAKTPTQPPTQAQTAPKESSTATKPSVKHVHVHMEGFELDKKSASQAGNTQVGSATRGAGPTVFLYAPHLTKVYTLTPTFYWTSAVHTKAFVFRLYDAEGEVGYETRTPDFSLQYPTSAPPLEPGQTYVWNVLAGLGLLGGGSLAAEFSVLSPEERAVLEKELAGADAMKRAAIFTDKRLWYDAIQAYTEIIAQHPEMADLYEKRGNIYDQIPATQDLAQADFEKADELRAKK